MVAKSEILSPSLRLRHNRREHCLLSDFAKLEENLLCWHAQLTMCLNNTYIYWLCRPRIMHYISCSSCLSLKLIYNYILRYFIANFWMSSLSRMTTPLPMVNRMVPWSTGTKGGKLFEEYNVHIFRGSNIWLYMLIVICL